MKTVTLTNNKGQLMKLPGSITLGQLVKMGLRRVRLDPIGSPIPDGFWADATPGAKKRKKKK